MTGETWRVVLEGGEAREVLVTRHPDGWWNARHEADGRMTRCMATQSARVAVTHVASALAWPVVEVIAPGQTSTAADAAHYRARLVAWVEAHEAKLQERDAQVAAMLGALRCIYATVAPERARLTAETFPARAGEVPEQFAALVASEVRDYAESGARRSIDRAAHALYQKAHAYQQLALAGGGDAPHNSEVACKAAANAYEHAAMIVREETHAPSAEVDRG